MRSRQSAALPDDYDRRIDDIDIFVVHHDAARDFDDGTGPVYDHDILVDVVHVRANDLDNLRRLHDLHVDVVHIHLDEHDDVDDDPA